jgi:hypothetical protein
MVPPLASLTFHVHPVWGSFATVQAKYWELLVTRVTLAGMIVTPTLPDPALPEAFPPPVAPDEPLVPPDEPLVPPDEPLVAPDEPLVPPDELDEPPAALIPPVAAGVAPGE